ncbi:MAG: DUF4129 domain-containing protein [Verrucomicrobiota bacterium]
MATTKPVKTPADYIVVGLSPVLIMLLVGSLCFFLIEVFFRGEAVGSVRWVMFWFVMAVVLVSRIGIEQGTGIAAVYGLGLAAATWLYLVRIHPAFIMGMILLGIVWWCAHKLTWDCTLIEDDEDASGNGLLETAGQLKKPAPPEAEPPQAESSKLPKVVVAQTDKKQKRAIPHSPGLWVVYFSVAAIPLFGIGQVLLPRDDNEARHMGFNYLFVYLLAAMGLLLSTSFLGLRRYLRQRYLPMPPMIAFGWIRFGTGLAAFVLIGALLLPRPGANEAWQNLRYQVDNRLRQASDYAMRFGPHGNGRGREGKQAGPSNTPKNPTANSPQPEPGQGQSPSPGQNGTVQDQGVPSDQPPPLSGGNVYNLFKILFLLAVVLLAGWWLFSRRELVAQVLKSIIASIRQFFRDLFGLGAIFKRSGAPVAKRAQLRRPFAEYHNPFLSGNETTWSRARLVLYSYDALRAWAEEKGVAPRPEQTAREFCAELSGRFPEMNSELNQLSSLYGQAAYTTSAAEGCDLEPVKNLWRYFYA